MAKNYSLTEAVQVIVENEDAAQLVELGKRFPLLMSKVTRIAVKSGEELNDLMQFMPENLTANKVNQNIKRALEEDNEDIEGEDFEEDDIEEDVPKNKSKSQVTKGGKSTKDETVTNDCDYDSWNNARMYKYLGEIGKRKDCKEKMGGFSHDQMLKYLKKYGPQVSSVEDDIEDGETEGTPVYENMSAVELYKLCKQRKIKAEQKKPAKYYVALLKKADEEAEQVEDDVEEDWDDGEEEEEVPVKTNKAKKEKSSTKSTTKGKTKTVKEEEEDDEDWDI